MNKEEIKKTWNEAARKIYQPTPEEYEMIYRTRKMTALENLAGRYKSFSRLGFIMIAASLMWFFGHFPFENQTMKYVVGGVMMVYFAACGIIDRWLYKGVSSIDCFTMTVNEVIRKALYYRKRHLQSIMFLLPFAILVIGLLAYSMSADIYVIYGIIAGAITGIILGSIQLRKFLRTYRIISED
ncbi:MAG: hypothetical protein K2M31_09150 [Muribaculaceae bacterium]|nr:hypothetical protein [Muribaculaceae bacterium]